MATKQSNPGFSDEEKRAMKEYAAELRAQAKREKDADKAAADLQDVLDKISEMPDEDRVIAEKVHELVLAAAPQLASRTWYGMPAYTLDGKVVAFFKPSVKFGSRYCTLGFEDRANVDDGTFWPTSYAVTAIGPAEERAITELIRRAVSEP